MFSNLEFSELGDGKKLYDGDLELVKFNGYDIPIYHKPECKCCCECCKCQGYTTWNKYVIAIDINNKQHRYNIGYSLGDFLQKNNLRIEVYGEKINNNDIIRREMEIEHMKYHYTLNFTNPKLDIYGNEYSWWDRFWHWLGIYE